MSGDEAWITDVAHELSLETIEDILREKVAAGDLTEADLYGLLDHAANLGARRNGDEPTLEPADVETPQPAVRVVPVDEFAAADEPSAEPLLGDDEDVLIPADGTVLFYGDGGAGKTTTVIDAIAHLAAGVPWLEIPVARSVRVLLVENEGPRGLFRRKLRRKASGWTGRPWTGQVFVLEEPWARATFAAGQIRDELATIIETLGIELLAAGPLKRLGMEGGGTPDEVSRFGDMLADLRATLSRPLAVLLVHHENKAGDVSGAWSGEPDTLIHVRPDGRQRTVLRVEKARWAPTLHGSKLTLAWADNDGFEIIDRDGAKTAIARAAEELDALEWLREHVTDHYAATGAGLARGKVETAYHEAHGNHGRNLARRVIDREIDAWNALLSGEATAEDSPTLATGPGEVKNGTYLYPAEHAPSPLAATLHGEGGEHPSDPRPGGTPRHLAAPPKGGEGGGEEGPRVATEQPDEDEIERLAALEETL